MAGMKAAVRRIDLKFINPGKTSRGTMTTRVSWLLVISDGNNTGIGECAPLPGLSIDENPEEMLARVCRCINTGRELPDLSKFPSVHFAVEMAQLDHKNGGNRILFPSSFTKGETSIPINGLVWMGSPDFMLAQVHEKISKGFNCIKLKIGGLDFIDEISVLKQIRMEYGYEDLEIRLDANGAFSPGDALEKLKRLSAFMIHSLEQPLKPGQGKVLEQIISNSPIPIALDEELIGITGKEQKSALIKSLRPDYIVLKPSLIAGISGSTEWIHVAEEFGIGWWITSALESNMGLNSIAQWTATLKSEIPQGLGTGQIFQNNIQSPLKLGAGVLSYDPGRDWDFQ